MVKVMVMFCKQLADTYNMFNTAEATTWYAKATETTQDAEVL
jgi:hypothetical protein